MGCCVTIHLVDLLTLHAFLENWSCFRLIKFPLYAIWVIVDGVCIAYLWIRRLSKKLNRDLRYSVRVAQLIFVTLKTRALGRLNSSAILVFWESLVLESPLIVKHYHLIISELLILIHRLHVIKSFHVCLILYNFLLILKVVHLRLEVWLGFECWGKDRWCQWCIIIKARWLTITQWTALILVILTCNKWINILLVF